MAGAKLGGGTGWPASVSANNFAGYTGVNGSGGVNINNYPAVATGVFYPSGDANVSDCNRRGHRGRGWGRL